MAGNPKCSNQSSQTEKYECNAKVISEEPIAPLYPRFHHQGFKRTLIYEESLLSLEALSPRMFSWALNHCGAGATITLSVIVKHLVECQDRMMRLRGADVSIRKLVWNKGSSNGESSVGVTNLWSEDFHAPIRVHERQIIHPASRRRWPSGQHS